MERVASAFAVSLALLIVLSWSLAIVHVLTWWMLLGSCCLVGIAGFATLASRHSQYWQLILGRQYGPASMAGMLMLMPVVVWIVFILYRGWLYPVSSHDALAYHLPRAAMIATHHGYEYFDATTITISAYPANFELLLADVIVLTGTDRVTEWVSTVAYVQLLIVAGAIAERWWGKNFVAIASVVLLTGVMRVALLHSGGHKNDLLMSGVVLASALWTARWTVRGGAAPFLLAWGSIATAVGTKLSAAFLIVVVAPLFSYRIILILRGKLKKFERARFVVVLVAAVVLTFLLGSVTYFWNIKVVGVPLPSMDLGFNEGYGDWVNVLRVPYLLFARPFGQFDWGVWVPWRNEVWFWPNYEMYFSSFGPLATLTLLMAPLAFFYYRRRGDREIQRERLMTTFVVVAMFVLTMPIRLRPLGFFGSFTRFVMYLPPILASWSVAPILADLVNLSRRARLAAWMILGGVALFFLIEANKCARFDSFAPLVSVADIFENPDQDREIGFPKERAGSFVDRMAGPHDVVAYDGIVNACIYPAFGRDLTRVVIPLHVQPGIPVEIPPEVKWVVIDRNWNRVWNHPEFYDMGQAKRLLFHGTPKPIDLQLFYQLKNDPNFRLVFRQASLEQSVFERISP